MAVGCSGARDSARSSTSRRTPCMAALGSLAATWIRKPFAPAAGWLRIGAVRAAARGHATRPRTRPVERSRRWAPEPARNVGVTGSAELPRCASCHSLYDRRDALPVDRRSCRASLIGAAMRPSRSRSFQVMREVLRDEAAMAEVKRGSIAVCNRGLYRLRAFGRSCSRIQARHCSVQITAGVRCRHDRTPGSRRVYRLAVGLRPDGEPVRAR